MTTLQDIAAEAGVSPATVSNALRGKGRMRPSMREKIARIAAEKNYDISSMRDAPAGHVAVITETSYVFCTEISDGIISEATSMGLACPVFNLGLDKLGYGFDPPLKKVVPMAMALVEELPPLTSGIVYVSRYPRDLTNIMPPLKIPVVYVNGTAADAAACINYDDMQGACLAVTELTKSGRTKIGLISGPINSVNMANRLHGYQSALVNCHIDFNPTLMRVGEWTYESGRAMMTELLNQPNIPDAVFAQNDYMAIGAINAIREKGLRVPEDIAVVGFDNIDACLYCTPPLSSIAPPFSQMGTTAFRYLFSGTRGNFQLPCTFVKRESN